MEKKIVTLKIDVSKIDKSKLYKGQKGTYLDAVVFLDDNPDQYGNNGMITQSVRKEERQRGVKGAILGNARIVGGQQAGQATGQTPSTAEDEDSGLPF